MTEEEKIKDEANFCYLSPSSHQHHHEWRFAILPQRYFFYCIYCLKKRVML